MQHWHSETTLSKTVLPYIHFFPEDAVFFDIETTGFSHRHAMCYLIGCATRSGDTIAIDQFFATKKEEEKEIIATFLQFIHPYHTLITFNGNGFDIPFLTKRCEILELEQHLCDFSLRDIFKSLSALKNILKLDNYKQKTIEAFLGISREDAYNGGELINIYYDYQKTESSSALALLKLHNYEDVLGMTELLPVFSYINFFEGNFYVASLEKKEHDSSTENSYLDMTFTLTSDFPFPKRISYGIGDIYFTASQNAAYFTVKIYSGELKYFYRNYQDYYYLPKEDMAIHKSVAFYVDKNYRTRAKAATCYSRKTSCFLPQYESIITPYFKLEYQDKISYFECTKNFYQSDDAVYQYCFHILQHLLNFKKSTHAPTLR